MKAITYDNLINLISNKRVAIIGPADYVNKELSDNHGKYIDGFDIVIKLNSMIKFPEEHKLNLSKYYGEKMNVLASSFWYKNDDPTLVKDDVSRYTTYNNYKDIKDDLILFENTNRNLFNHIYQNYKSEFDKHNNFYYCNMSDDTFNQTIAYLNKITCVKKMPTTGLLAIISVLLMKPIELYVSGITAYKDTKYNGYYDHYLDLSIEEVDNLNKNPNYRFDGKQFKKNFQFGHDVNYEQIIMKYLIDNNLISVDKYLKFLYK